MSFAALIAAGVGRCPKAVEVVRRGGSEFDCSDADAWQRCAPLQQHLQTLGLAALGHVDDLGATPKSVYDRVMLGGLVGIAESLPDDPCPPVDSDIGALVEAAYTRFPEPRLLPADNLIRSIEQTRSPRRRNSRR